MFVAPAGRSGPNQMIRHFFRNKRLRSFINFTTNTALTEVTPPPPWTESESETAGIGCRRIQENTRHAVANAAKNAANHQTMLSLQVNRVVTVLC